MVRPNLITIFGETKSESEWVRDKRAKVGRYGFRRRLAKGFSPETALCTSSYKTRVSYDENFFDKIDNEVKAYFLGFIYADGCVFNLPDNKQFGLTINLAVKDRELLVKFKNAIRFTGKIREYANICKRGSYPCVRIKLNGKHICDSLTRLGCPPRKTLVLQYPNFLNEDLERHFLRGYIDGDGSIKVCRCKTGYYTYHVAFVSTESFCRGVQKVVSERIAVSSNYYPYLRASRPMCTWSANGKRNVLKLLNWLYEGATTYLERKFLKHQALLRKVEECILLS